MSIKILIILEIEQINAKCTNSISITLKMNSILLNFKIIANVLKST